MNSSPRLLVRLRTSKAFIIGMCGICLLTTVALSANILFPEDPLDMVGPPTLWPGTNLAFPLGTDVLGRNIASGIAHGAQISLAIGFLSALISVVVGVAVGAAAGYTRGVVDDLLMRVTEFFQTIPSFLFAIILVLILQPSIGSIIIAIGSTTWPQIARLTRAEVLRVREADYVHAATTMGRRHIGIIIEHVLPNSIAPVVIATSVLVANAILMEASLSFLGLSDPNVPTWGAMIGVGRDVLRTAWYMSALPGLAVFVTVMSFTLLGNGLNDILNPRDAL